MAKDPIGTKYNDEQVEALWLEYDENGLNLACPNCQDEDGMEINDHPPSPAGNDGRFVVRCTNCGSSGSRVIKNPWRYR